MLERPYVLGVRKEGCSSGVRKEKDRLRKWESEEKVKPENAETNTSPTHTLTQSGSDLCPDVILTLSAYTNRAYPNPQVLVGSPDQTRN